MSGPAENIADVDIPAPSREVDTSGLSNAVNELESLCIACEKQGTTRLLLTKIPYFKDVVIISFECPHCGFKNSEIDSVGEIQPKGIQYTFKVETVDDLSRTVVKADKATAKIEEIGLEIVPGKGQVTNVEGLVSKVADDLAMLQERRQTEAPEVYVKLEEVIAKLRALADGSSFPFTVSMDDPTGNSWIQPVPGEAPGKLVKNTYVRGPELNAQLGYVVQPSTESTEDAPAPKVGVPKSVYEQAALKRLHAPLTLPREGELVRSIGAEDGREVEKQVHEFETVCPNCGNECTSNMTMVDIPFFKEVILMCLVCTKCGYRNNEVKSGGAIPPFGQKITLNVSSPEDLDRSVVKSDTCAIHCPELEFSYEPSGLGGCISTVEGILVGIREEIDRSVNGGNASGDADNAGGGDSISPQDKQIWDYFFNRMDKAIAGKMEFTIEFKDPLASTYVERLDKGGEFEDTRLKVEDYTRSREEDDSFGLLDMKTEGYENDKTIREEDEEAAEGAEKVEKRENETKAGAETDSKVEDAVQTEAQS